MNDITIALREWLPECESGEGSLLVSDAIANLERLERENAALRAALNEIDSIIDGNGDIDGEGRPNRLMQIQAVIDQALSGHQTCKESTSPSEGVVIYLPKSREWYCAPGLGVTADPSEAHIYARGEAEVMLRHDPDAEIRQPEGHRAFRDSSMGERLAILKQRLADCDYPGRGVIQCGHAGSANLVRFAGDDVMPCAHVYDERDRLLLGWLAENAPRIIAELDSRTVACHSSADEPEALRKSETPKGGVGIQTPRPGSTPGALDPRFVQVPWHPTEEQLGGLAREVLMWIDMTPTRESDRSGGSLLAFLKHGEHQIPDWLRFECRDKPNLSKQDRAAIIYRAMLEAAPGSSLSQGVEK